MTLQLYHVQPHCASVEPCSRCHPSEIPCVTMHLTLCCRSRCAPGVLAKATSCVPLRAHQRPRQRWCGSHSSKKSLRCGTAASGPALNVCRADPCAVRYEQPPGCGTAAAGTASNVCGTHPCNLQRQQQLQRCARLCASVICPQHGQPLRQLHHWQPQRQLHAWLCAELCPHHGQRGQPLR